MKLKSIVKKELKNLKLPPYKVTIKKHSEVYPDNPKKINSYQIKISINSKSDHPEEDCSCSHLDFWYNAKEQRIEHIKFSMKELKGIGLGRKLVNSMEEIGKKLGCLTSRVCVNTNEIFWKKMGYKPIENYWEKQIIDNNRNN